MPTPPGFLLETSRGIPLLTTPRDSRVPQRSVHISRLFVGNAGEAARLPVGVLHPLGLQPGEQAIQEGESCSKVAFPGLARSEAQRTPTRSFKVTIKLCRLVDVSPALHALLIDVAPHIEGPEELIKLAPVGKEAAQVGWNGGWRIPMRRRLPQHWKGFVRCALFHIEGSKPSECKREAFRFVALVLLNALLEGRLGGART